MTAELLNLFRKCAGTMLCLVRRLERKRPVKTNTAFTLDQIMSMRLK